MEIHLVHVNTMAPNISVALADPEGLAVIGILFEISATDNPALSPLIDILANVTVEG